MMDLKDRERKLIAVSAAIVLVALIHWLIVSPVLRKRADLERRIALAGNQLNELRLLQREYDQILEETKKINQHMSALPRDFALFSFLDQTANRLDLKNNLTSLKPSRRNLDADLTEEMVEVRLEGISLENLAAYLHEIERASAAIAIASIRIQPESKLGGGLNVSMLVTSIGPS
ncbi:MAG: type II secretion system protein M [Candidatus Hydrogenedentota bacterium]|nr:MAG: type II secretion system protein M [Candidatus Hydrogenedentota bacterium]